MRSVIEGRRLVVVDDSIVRGTTSRKIVRMLRDAGAREVHLRITAPPIVASCYYGVDTPRADELIAHRMEVEGIREYIGADSLGYLSLAGLRAAQGEQADAWCEACFTGDHPVDPRTGDPAEQMPLFVSRG